MSLLTLLKKSVRRILRELGFELLRVRRLGRNAFADALMLDPDRSFRTVFDIGANTGQTTAELLAQMPDARIFAFEPFPEAFAQLATQYGGQSRVVLNPVALSDHAGTADFYVNAASVTNSMLPNAAGSDRYQPAGMAEPCGRTPVTVTTLDEYCRSNHIDQIDLLKTDTQGSDLTVLRGGADLLSTGRVKWVLAEVLYVPLYEGQANFHELYAFMLEHRYRLVGLYNGWMDHQHLCWADALFVRADD